MRRLEPSFTERTVPERFCEQLARVEAIADAACHAFGELHPHTARDADDAAKMKAGVLRLEPARVNTRHYRCLPREVAPDLDHPEPHVVELAQRFVDDVLPEFK